jgi:uncharacterized membrane protein YkvI
MEIDPESKSAIDALVAFEQRRSDRRAWSFWLAVAVLSVIAALASRIQSLPELLQAGFLIVGVVGLLLFLAFLSTKPFGRDFYNGPEWWDLWW